MLSPVSVPSNTCMRPLKNYTGMGGPNSTLFRTKFNTALIYLHICDFNGIKALPEWLGNLSSLQTLLLNSNENLMEMPTVQAM